MAYPVPFAVDDFSSAVKPTGADEQQSTQYQTIGETLMICEACCLAVGIPWLPPGRIVRGLVAKYEGPLDEFVRLSLVTVSTNNLESYCEDLETTRPDETSAAELAIRPPSVFERFFASGLAFLAVSVLSAWIAAITGSSLHLVWLGALACGAIAALMIALLCLEAQRRSSFAALLNRELLRRKGLDPTNSNRLNVLSIET